MRALRSILPVLILAAAALAPAAEESWYRAPRLAVMTGYIKEPLKPYSIREWEKGLGNQMDADRWVAGFKQAGASYLIFYDKWIDGFVFHDTKTTGFKTRRDFVRDVAEACQRGGLPLVFYFNAVSDGNPEFKEWALLDRRGKPIVFSPNWPTGYQTLHSPFRRISVEQVRELMTRYGRIHGMWLDIFGERLHTTSPFVAGAYEKMYGVPFDKAPPATLGEFNARTLAGYLDEVRPIAKEHQPDCVWTSNGAGSNMLHSAVWAKWVGARLDYGSNEGHHFHRMDQLARMAWINPKPLEIGLLLNKTWFTPMEDAPPPACMTPPQATAAAAVAVCQGATVYMALTPGHSGRFGEDLEVAKAVGAWFRTVEPMLEDARPYADVGIVLGAASADGPGLAGVRYPWKLHQAPRGTVLDQAVAAAGVLQGQGVFSRLLYASGAQGSWPDSLTGFRAILLPERAPLDDAHAEKLRRYVKGGGRLVALGHASMLDAEGKPREDFALADVFGARYKGEAALGAKSPGATVKVDSEYSAEFAGGHLIDGLPTAWASGGTPMPHWAELTLAEPVEVAKVELVSRQGPYLVTDVDVEVHDGKEWQPAASVRGATKRLVLLALDRPARTTRVRVKILRELYEGQDRQYADVESIRVLDTEGRDRSTRRVELVPLAAAAPELKAAFEGRRPSVPPMAVAVKPTTAEVIATTQGEPRVPVILRNRFGKGEAILLTTGGNGPLWSLIRQLAVGGPTLRCDQAARYRIILTEVGGAHVLHVIDRTAGSPGYKPAEVTVSLDAARLGGPKRATLAGTDTAVKTQQADGQITFTVRPDPVASVVLE